MLRDNSLKPWTNVSKFCLGYSGKNAYVAHYGL